LQTIGAILIPSARLVDPAPNAFDRGGGNMAIAVDVSFRGASATLDKYLQGIANMGATPEGRHPNPGCLFHWITVDPGGLRITDVWKTRAEFDDFARDKIGPVSAAVGLPQPHVKFVDVANFLTAG
jgi:hypothetical protein